MSSLDYCFRARHRGREVNPLDPTVYLAVAGLLALVSALSCFQPARRATRVDPMIALLYE